jgi:hypothetical protein
VVTTGHAPLIDVNRESRPCVEGQEGSHFNGSGQL